MKTHHIYIYIYIYDTKNDAKYCFVIQYHRNVSMNSQWISINTNSILLGSLSSPTLTVRETTSEMTCNSAIIADATSGREQLWKNVIQNTCL